ncbi:MAG: sigma-E processing peptidase SpoIIGA [Oscillospiraceae bacterium]|nr:sigma-E processing peptidase SpoIIGA [Oscillospiraceae bacterium]
MTVWGEAVFFLNAALDYLLLAGAVRLRGGLLRRRRLAAAAMLGGSVSLLSLYCASPLFTVGGLLLLLLCAFGCSLEALRCALLFLGLACALCGTVEWLARLLSPGAALTRSGVLLSVSWRLLLAAGGLLYGVCTLLSGALRGHARTLTPVRITVCGRTVQLRALIDTGSFLSDPLSGSSVLLADSEIAALLFSLTPEQLRTPERTLQMLASAQPSLRPRLIPYRAVGTPCGLLLGIVCAEIAVGRQHRRNAVLALSPEVFSADGTYHALTGG